MRSIARATDEQLLAELGPIAARLERNEAQIARDYARRLEVWQALVDRKVDRAVIAAASSISVSAIGYALHAARKRRAAAGG